MVLDHDFVHWTIQVVIKKDFVRFGVSLQKKIVSWYGKTSSTNSSRQPRCANHGRDKSSIRTNSRRVSGIVASATAVVQGRFLIGRDLDECSRMANNANL